MNPEYGSYQKGIKGMVNSFIHRKINSGMKKFVAQELHESVIKNFMRRKVYSMFKENTWTADLADMELLSCDNLVLSIYCSL